jgi:serine/threonine protein kinase
MDQERGAKLNLINSGAFGCIYRPSLTCDGKMGSAKYITKIQKSERTIANELSISERIRKMRGYARFFAPVLKYCNVRIKKDLVKDLNKCEIFEKYTESEITSRSYVSMKTRYVGDKDLKSHIFSHTKISAFLNELWRTYVYLLKGIQKLFANKILHYDLKHNNIIYDPVLNAPIIIDFGQSWAIDKINTEDEISMAFFVFAQYDYWCIDTLICSYIIQKIGYKESKTELVTESEVDYIYDVFIYGRDPKYTSEGVHQIKKIDSDVFLYNILQNPEKMLNFKTTFHKYIEPFVGKRTWWELYEDLIKYANTWDLYSLSIVYLNMIDDIYLEDASEFNKIMTFTNGKMGKYVEILESIVYCKPNERPNIAAVLKQVELLARS